MPSPQLNLRVSLEHHAILKAVAAHLRSDAAFKDQLAALVAGVADPLADVASDGPLASIIARLEVLEALEGRVEALERERQEGLQTITEGAGKALEESEALEPVEAAGRTQTRRKWTSEDDDVLRRVASVGGTQADACHELKRPSSVIHAKWKALGLTVEQRAGRKLKRRQG